MQTNKIGKTFLYDEYKRNSLIDELFIIIFLISLAFCISSNKDAEKNIVVSFISFPQFYMAVGLIVVYTIIKIVSYINRNTIIKINCTGICLLLMCVITLIPLFMNFSQMSVTAYLSHYAPFVASALLYFFFAKTNCRNNVIITAFYMFGIILVIQVILTIITKKINFFSPEYKHNLQIPFAGSNVIAAMLVAILFMICYSKMKAMPKIAGCIFFIVGIVLTKSRGALAITIVLSVITMFLYLRNKKAGIITVLVFAISIFIIFICLTQIPEIKYYLWGFAEDKLQGDISNGRVDLLINAIKIGFDNFFFGTGLVYDQENWDTGAHNLIVDLFAKTGITGLLIYTTAVVSLFYKSSKNGKKNKSNMPYILFLLVILIYSQIDTCYFNMKFDPLFWSVAGIYTSKCNRYDYVQNNSKQLKFDADE